VQQLAERGASTAKEVQDRMTDRALTFAALKSAEAAMKQAELDLGYTRVLTPINGRVGRNLVDPGNLVGAGEQPPIPSPMPWTPHAVPDLSVC